MVAHRHNLATFIRNQAREIVESSVEFAKTLGPLAVHAIELEELRDHLGPILEAIAKDIETPQSAREAKAKSEGKGPNVGYETAAQMHGRLRADSGLTIAQVVAEYRVLRATVIRLWTDGLSLADRAVLDDLTRFNEAIDQAIAESVSYHSQAADRWRQVLLGLIAHDLRGPLNAIVMIAEVLRLRSSRGGDCTEQLDLLNRSTARMVELLDSLLDLNRSQLGAGMELKLVRADIVAGLCEEIDLVRAGHPDVRIEFAGRGDTVGRFDVGRVREALANLLTNAIQYRVPDTPIVVAVTGQDDSVVISVSNRCLPLAPGTVERMFEPLVRDDPPRRPRSRTNLGLGLFIVREIARAHGGEASAVESDGAITITLALSKAGEADPV